MKKFLCLILSALIFLSVLASCTEQGTVKDENDAENNQTEQTDNEQNNEPETYEPENLAPEEFETEGNESAKPNTAAYPDTEGYDLSTQEGRAEYLDRPTVNLAYIGHDALEAGAVAAKEWVAENAPMQYDDSSFRRRPDYILQDGDKTYMIVTTCANGKASTQVEKLENGKKTLMYSYTEKSRFFDNVRLIRDGDDLYLACLGWWGVGFLDIKGKFIVSYINGITDIVEYSLYPTRDGDYHYLPDYRTSSQEDFFWNTSGEKNLNFMVKLSYPDIQSVVFVRTERVSVTGNDEDNSDTMFFEMDEDYNFTGGYRSIYNSIPDGNGYYSDIVDGTRIPSLVFYDSRLEQTPISERNTVEFYDYHKNYLDLFAYDEIAFSDTEEE